MRDVKNLSANGLSVEKFLFTEKNVPMIKNDGARRLFCLKMKKIENCEIEEVGACASPKRRLGETSDRKREVESLEIGLKVEIMNFVEKVYIQGSVRVRRTQTKHIDLTRCVKQ